MVYVCVCGGGGGGESAERLEETVGSCVQTGECFFVEWISFGKGFICVFINGTGVRK